MSTTAGRTDMEAIQRVARVCMEEASLLPNGSAVAPLLEECAARLLGLAHGRDHGRRWDDE